MFYLFSPLLENGKPVVRIPDKYDWYIDPYDEPTQMWMDMHEEIKKGTFGADEKFPILTMRSFPSDPHAEIRALFEQHKDAIEDIKKLGCVENRMITAIVNLVERLEVK